MASKITIKRSVTAAPPAGLSFGEMALVQGSGLTANQLYVGISGGNPVWVGAQIGTTGTWTDNAAKTSLATQFAIEERIGAKIAANTAGVASFNGLTGAVTGVASFNGLTGAVGGVTTSVANTFTALQTFSAGISTSGGTFGTPTQLIGTNITGTASGLTAGRVTTNANLTGAITSVGNATSLGSFTAQELFDALGIKTGTSKPVFDTSPTLITPTIGAAIATSINKVTITAPATGSTITITDGKTLAVNNTLTFTGTDASSVAFGAGGTVVYAATNVASFNGATGAVTGVSSFNGLTGAVGGVTTSVANTFTALQTFSAGISTSGGTFGTPTQLVGTNITGTATAFTASNVTTNANLTGHITSTGNAAVLGSFTSSQLATALTDETGSGAAVFATSPTLVTPALGTPSALVGTNITGTATAFTASNVTTNANLTGHITSTGNAAVLGSFTSSQLATALTDETGSGAAVFANTPTLVTPNIGAATGTSLVLSGDLTVNGTTTTLNSTTLTIDDKNIELGSVAVPDNTTAADGGITLKGATDKTLKWLNSGAFAWTSSENFDLVSTKAYYIAGASVLNATTLGSAIVNSSLTSVGTLTSLTVSGTLEAGLIDGGTF